MRTLRFFGESTLQFAADRGIRVVALLRTEPYATRSPSLRRLGIDVDAWPSPPAGLFVVEERTVYLRSHSAMTVAHEFGHALDCALGDGIYRSATDPEVKRLFKNATGFVTPYAATASDEYFAECLRAYVEVNDTNSLWPPATRRRLRRIDKEMYAYLQERFRTDFAS
ncbi:MAG TPA: hypothetical protein VFE17_06655 [Candidatus Baltobacteraceae bacterium]|nr:hypothetical protein [Candidatus Baltobacteraceae bacterium]